MNSKICFALPSTPLCQVVYLRGGVRYGSIIQTPRSTTDLQIAMLKKQVALSEIQTINPVQPRQALQRAHPVQNHLNHYISGSDRL